ncbi:hypothetical protein D3C75_906770 [compost metagenome]
MPRSNRALDKRPALNELPVITGITANPVLVAVSSPASRARRRNSSPRACTCATRSLSAASSFNAANAEAVTAGGMPTLYKKPGARNFRCSISAVRPAMYPPQLARVLLNVPIQMSTSSPANP